MVANFSAFFENWKKPLNPILGETFQGHYSGDPVYCE